MPGIADGGTWQSANLVPGEVAGYIAPDVILRAADEPRNRASTAADKDIRVLAVEPGEWPADLPRWDYRLFDSRDLWAMHYAWRPARYAQMRS